MPKWSFTLWVVALVSCAPVFRLVSDARVPAAEGEVRVGAGENDNTKLAIEVRHLAPPGKVHPGSTVYVVWALSKEEGAPAQNIGALRVDDALVGTLETLTPLKIFELSVTPEPLPAAAAPEGPKVLTAQISRNP